MTGHARRRLFRSQPSRQMCEAASQVASRCQRIGKHRWQANEIPSAVSCCGRDGGNHGQRGIRTLDTLSRIHAFQACAFNRSATCPTSYLDTTTTLTQKTKPPSRCVTAARKNGQGEIRTLDTLAGMPVFETGAFNRSATCPDRGGEPPIPQPSNIASRRRPVNEVTPHLSTCADGQYPWTRRNRLSGKSCKVAGNIWRRLQWPSPENAQRTPAHLTVTG